MGEAITRELIRQGCSVAIHYFSSASEAENLKREANEAGVSAIALQADLRDTSQAESVVQRAVDFLGGLDILINNAGDLVARVRLEEIDDAFWNRVFDVNLKSAMAVTRAAAAALSAEGNSSIVNLASLAGRKGGHPGSLVYSTAKGALITWTRALSEELAGRGIRVNCVAPGLILGSRFHRTHTTEESAKTTIAGIPLGRAGTPEDVARPVAFLASEYDGFITGVTLDINGGVYRA